MCCSSIPHLRIAALASAKQGCLSGGEAEDMTGFFSTDASDGRVTELLGSKEYL